MAFSDVVKSIGKPKPLKIEIPKYQKPIVDPSVKLQAPTGKELTIEQLPKEQRDQAEAETRQSQIQASGKKENFFQAVLRSPLRTLSSIILSTSNDMGGKVYTPKKGFESMVLGSEPIKSISEQYKEAEGTLEGAGYGKVASPIIAGTAVFGGAFMDLTFGGGKSKLAEQLTKATTRETVEAILRKAAVADDIVARYADDFVKATTKAEVNKILKNIDEVVKVGKALPFTDDQLYYLEDLQTKKLMAAETGKPVQLSGWAGIKGSQDSGFRSVSRDVAQSYSNVKGGKPAVQFFDNLKKPYVAQDQNEVLKNLGQKGEDMLAELRAQGGKLGSDNLAVQKADRLIREELSRQGYDSVIYKLNGRREPEWQLFDLTTTSKTPRFALPDARDEAGKLLAETKAKATGKEALPESPASILSKEKMSVEAVDTSSKLYQESVRNTIGKAAREVGERPPVVRRVTDSLKKLYVNTVEYVQNSEKRIKDLVGRPGMKVSDVSDPYLRATLYPGRVAQGVEAGRNEAKLLVQDIKKVADDFASDIGQVRKQVNDYLLFKHAPERNLALGERAAGIGTDEAKAGLKALEELPAGKKIQELAARAQALNKQVLEMLHESGVISTELYNTLLKKYKNHVPLQRIFEETDDFAGALAGKGFDVRSTGIKRAVGSEREVDDILANIVTNYEQAVLRSEKNIVDNATLAFVRDNEKALDGLFEIVQPKAIGKSFDGKVLMERTTDPTILQMFEKGKPVWVKINDEHLAAALRGIGREKLGSFLNAIGTFTRTYSGLATRFNPEFALPNKIRDLQETAVYLASQEGIGFKGAAKTVLRDLRQQNTKAVIDFLRGADTEGARLYKELKELGGTTGGFGLSTKAQVKMNIEKLEALATSPTKKLANNLIEYVDNWNTIFEDSTRLSVYRQALDQGLSKDRAAFLAKEASINFNRMGKGGPVINALWMFSNASIQGSAKMIRSLKNPKVLATTVAVVGGAVAAVNEWNNKVDPEWRDKVAKWDRLNGLPLMIPSTEGEARYITIPVSWGIKPIKVAADYAFDALDGQGFSTKKFMEDSVISILEAYNPVGGTDMTSAITPTILDVPVEIARNKAWSGNKIRPDYDPNAPEDIKYFRSLEETKIGQVAISISEALKKYTGIAISPANMKYAYDQYVGGAGRAVSKAVNVVTGAATGKPAPLDEYPFISRFYRQRSAEEMGAGAGGEPEEIKRLLQEQSRDRFYVQKEAERLYNEWKALPKEEANAKAAELKKSKPEVFEKLKDVAKDEKMGLTYEERLIKQLGVENGERARYIWQQAKDLPTSEEKNAYIKKLRDRGLVSDTVLKQLKKLKSQ